MRTETPELEVEPWPAGGWETLPSAQTDATVWRDLEGRIIAFGRRNHGEDQLQIPGLALFRWRDDAEVVIAHPEPGTSWLAVIDAFERGVLPLALQSRGLQVLHASAVLTSAGVVAFCGRSHSGKSTLAYACSRRWRGPLWADDAVAFNPEGNVVRAVALPFSMKLRPATVAHFKIVGGEESNGAHSGKDTASASLPRAGELAALFTLKRTTVLDRPAEVERVPATKSFTELLEHAYCFDLVDPARTQRTVTQYLELCAAVPVFELRFSASFETLPLVLDEVMLALDALGGVPMSSVGS